MNLLKQFSVRGKLILAFSVVLLLMACLAINAAVGGTRIHSKARMLIDIRLAGVRDSLLMAEAATRMRTRDFRVAITETKDLPAAVVRLEKSKEEFEQFRQSYQDSIADNEERRLYDKAMADWAAYVAISDRGVALAREGDIKRVQQYVGSVGLKSFDTLAASLKALATYNDRHAQADGAEVAVLYRQGMVTSAVLVVCAMGLAVLLGWAITRAIVKPLNNAVAMARHVARGDLSMQLHIEGRDEMAQLQQALADMVTQLRTVVTEVRDGVESVGTASSQIAMGNADLSQRTEEQASNLQQTAASMEQLTSIVSQNAAAANQATELASRAAGVARKGGEVVGEVVNTMNAISASSRKVVDIIGVIDAIAFQTNILALNAAVEAARAGEQGRGFAVVASEVRTLAQRSAQAAKEIKVLIDASVGQVESGATLVGDAGKTMDDIVVEVKRVSDLIAEISLASNEQSMGIAQVGHAVAQLDQVTQQNAALVEEAAAAADSMKHQAARLADAVSVFQVDAVPA